MCHPHRDTFYELEQVTGNKLKRKTHLYFAHHSLSEDVEKSKFTVLCRQWSWLGQLVQKKQTEKMTHITCGYTKKLPEESTNLGSDMKLYYQAGKSPDFSTWMDRFGTKTGSECGILKTEISQPRSHQDQESLEAIQESGKDYQHHSLNNNKNEYSKRYIFLTRIIKIIHTFISM